MEFPYFLIPGIALPLLAVSSFCCLLSRVSRIERRVVALENRNTFVYTPPTSYSMPPYQPAPSAPLDHPSDLEWGVRVA